MHCAPAAAGRRSPVATWLLLLLLPLNFALLQLPVASPHIAAATLPQCNHSWTNLLFLLLKPPFCTKATILHFPNESYRFRAACSLLVVGTWDIGQLVLPESLRGNLDIVLRNLFTQYSRNESHECPNSWSCLNMVNITTQLPPCLLHSQKRSREKEPLEGFLQILPPTGSKSTCCQQ